MADCKHGFESRAISVRLAQTEALTYAKGGDAGHKFAWEIDLTQVTLANLNYKKMSLVRDFADAVIPPLRKPRAADLE